MPEVKNRGVAPERASSSILGDPEYRPYICECCPKKPKKFGTLEQLSKHEAEKQYECTFCPNRFKSRNEAIRHLNSVHLRHHSWSCSALGNAGAPFGLSPAFHDSPSQPGVADSCGYCGEDFARNGGGAAVGDGGVGDDGDGALCATVVDWHERLHHMRHVHHYMECNKNKRFYRADHFRQHLKHSHAGTSGRWTNLLENACMLEEEPPQPRVSKVSALDMFLGEPRPRPNLQ
ncbi:Uu.00g089430.m01.CDS01 [Anthostomella pinea]|uniref:Uu.00g089430.m01.CDS01 n=1 Tax=Anthostomella pinea TaxID=933095 RepID=A0AAI8YK75_9PEZI|nr:Uu.00g089430.m01.CDS01 [Anthostomella pinea]